MIDLVPVSFTSARAKGCAIGRVILPNLSPAGAGVLRGWLASSLAERGNSAIVRACNAQWAGTDMPRLTERIVGTHRRGDCTCTEAGLA